MFKVKKGLVVFLTMVLLVVAFSMPVYAGGKGSSGGGTKPTTKTVNYVALGDSIATGTVTNWSNITSYVTYFSQYLKTYYGKGTTVNLQNLAHDGDRSSELLSKLQTNQTFRTAVANANIITISIGGNNLMKAAEIPGFTTIDWDLAAQGVQDFTVQWPAIINEINALNEGKAKIIVNTIYNPYNIDPPTGYQADVGLHDLTDGKLTDINSAIMNNTSLGYRIADIYTAFDASSQANMGDITYFYPPLITYLLRNPHPNTVGQQIITDLTKKAFLAP